MPVCWPQGIALKKHLMGRVLRYDLEGHFLNCGQQFRFLLLSISIWICRPKALDFKNKGLELLNE